MMASSTSMTEARGLANDEAAVDATSKADRPVSGSTDDSSVASSTTDDSGVTSSTTDDGSGAGKEKEGVQGHEDEEENTADIMRGRSLILFTIGMMAVVFMLCLDHYILGRFFLSQCLGDEAELTVLEQPPQYLASRPTSTHSPTRRGTAVGTF